MVRPLIAFAVHGLPALLLSNPLMAASWDWGSRVGLNAAWADNPALANDSRNPISTFRLLAIYDGDIVRLTPATTLQIGPRVTRDYYPDKERRNLESTDFFLPGNYRRIGQRSNLFLGWNLSRQNVLSDESTVSEDNDFTSLNADDKVYRASITPGITWTVSESDQLFFNFGAFVTKYDLPFTNRADSTGALGSFSYGKGIGERQRLGFSASYNVLESENTNFRTFFFGEPVTVLTERITNASSTSFTLDYSYKLSVTSSLNLKAGLQSSTSEVESTILQEFLGAPPPIALQPVKQTFDSTTYDIVYRRDLQRGEFNVSASRRVSANVQGQPQDRYEFLFGGNFDWTTKLTTGWRFITWQQQNVIFAEAGLEAGKTRYFGADLNFNWQYSQKWSVTGRYAYQYRERTQQTDTAQGNRISLGLTYRFKKFQRR